MHLQAWCRPSVTASARGYCGSPSPSSSPSVTLALTLTLALALALALALTLALALALNPTLNPTLGFMQTDPNWSNFLYEPRSGQLSLIDFGACQQQRRFERRASPLASRLSLSWRQRRTSPFGCLCRLRARLHTLEHSLGHSAWFGYGFGFGLEFGFGFGFEFGFGFGCGLGLGLG